jgi:hypothetical protein
MTFDLRHSNTHNQTVRHYGLTVRPDNFLYFLPTLLLNLIFATLQFATFGLAPKRLDYKKTFFKKFGNHDIISLNNLCNRQYFFDALEILMGIRFQKTTKK